MGVLALTISRTATQTNTATIQELTNIQSFYAAESGAQRGMQALFLTTTTRNATDAACANMAINHNFAGVNGLQMCFVVVSCSCRYQDGSACAHGSAANYLPASPVGVTKSFYTIRSVGTCGPADHFRAQRIIEVGAYREQE
ncbi:MSHA biogenesis protein MshP [Cellvibrio sp. UBA7661]|uniref:MSHA biogenesis protein MshP n=1 Tax=Cellvibrio sp. UBA7661 TaxID=1946311 RepID=UPI002F35F179